MPSDSTEHRRTATFPKRSLFFHPNRPSQFQVLEHLRQFAGWDLASIPETADWCVLFDAHATWVTLPEDDPFAESASTWINGGCRDISKRTVERVFEAVFGYPLAIDPLTHQGLCLRKSNQNCVKVNGVKDVRILACPIPLGDVDEQYVYERLVDSRVPGLGTIELRTTVVEGEVISVWREIKQDWISTGSFADNPLELDIAVVYPSSVFSDQELEQIRVFCEAMGLDFGRLDIMRDNEDQRIYILDANTTPTYGSNPMAHRIRLEQLARVFIEHYPPRSAVSPSSLSAATLHGTNRPQDGIRSLLARIDGQTERIARLEAAVGEASAGITQVLAADAVAPQRSGKKKRKK